MRAEPDRLEVYEDADALVRAAADRVIAVAADAIMLGGRFSIGLSGGSTPRPLYELLARDDYARRIEWSRTHVFWGDERCVPPEDPESNYGMAQQALLAHVPIPEENVHRMRGELPPVEAAADYEDLLRAFFGELPGARPRFDLLLQGLGSDGHTASLFPHSAALDERARWVAAPFVPRLGAWRITLTPPAINAAGQVIFLVDGAGKAEALRAVLRGPYRPHELPAQLIRPAGELAWMVDAAAAALLEPA